jgi:hypothetical protein
LIVMVAFFFLWQFEVAIFHLGLSFNKWPEDPFFDTKKGSPGHLLKLSEKGQCILILAAPDMEVPTSHAEAEGRSSPISLTPARASFFEGCHRTISTKDLSYLSFFY